MDTVIKSTNFQSTTDQSNMDHDAPSLESANENKYLTNASHKKDARFFETIDECFGELQQGYKIAVWRKKPAWCKGHQGTVEVDFDDKGKPKISIEDFKEEFGGDVLQLKFLNEHGKYLFAKTIEIYGYPPKRDHIVLKSPEQKEREESLRLEQARMSNTQNNGNEKMFEMMLTLLTSQMSNQNPTNENADILKFLLQQMNQQKNITPNPSPVNPMNQLTDMVKMMKLMKNTFGNEQPQPQANENNDDESITKMIGGVFDMIKGSGTNPLDALSTNPPSHTTIPKPRIKTVPLPTNLDKHPVVNAPMPSFGPNIEPKTTEDLQIIQNDAVLNNDNENVDDFDESEALGEVQGEAQGEDVDLIEHIASYDVDDIANIVDGVTKMLPKEKMQELMVRFAKL